MCWSIDSLGLQFRGFEREEPVFSFLINLQSFSPTKPFSPLLFFHISQNCEVNSIKMLQAQIQHLCQIQTHPFSPATSEFTMSLWNNNNSWWLLCSCPSTRQPEQPAAEDSHRSIAQEASKQGHHCWLPGTSLHLTALPQEAQWALDGSSLLLLMSFYSKNQAGNTNTEEDIL